MSTATDLLAEADTLSHTAAVLRHRAATLAEGIATMSEAEWDAGWALCALREELRRWEPAWAASEAREATRMARGAPPAAEVTNPAGTGPLSPVSEPWTAERLRELKVPEHRIAEDLAKLNDPDLAAKANAKLASVNGSGAKPPSGLASSLIDWAEFWAEEPEGNDWLVEPLIPAARQVAMYSPAKAGKSLLMLEIVAALATGRAVLSRPAGEPVHVVYVDMENTRADLRERLEQMGYGPDDDLSHLHYYSFPPLATGMDNEADAVQLEALVIEVGAVLVVLDTMARMVSGPENDSDTYRNFYRHTGTRLKRLGVALVRLDHAGKEAEKGQRGSSSKNDDVDVVWRLTCDPDWIAVHLTRTHSRVGWVSHKVELTRHDDDVLYHGLAPVAEPAGVRKAIDDLDEIGAPENASNRDALHLMRQHGKPGSIKVISPACRFRRQRSIEANKGNKSPESCVLQSGERGVLPQGPGRRVAETGSSRSEGGSTRGSSGVRHCEARLPP